MIRVKFSLLISQLSNLMICHHLKMYLGCTLLYWKSVSMQTAKHYSDLSKIQTTFSSYLLGILQFVFLNS